MDRFTWGIVAGAVLLVALAVGSVAALQARGASPDLTTPSGVVRTYYLAMEADRPEEAWDLLSSSAQAQTTRDEFIRRATGASGGRSGRVTIDRVEESGTTATVFLSETSGGGGLFDGGSYTSSVRVRLDREGGRWRISVPPQPYLLDSPRSVPAPVTSTPIPVPSPSPSPRPAA